MLKALGFALPLAFGAFAQSQEPKIVVNLDGFRYPPIARLARIDGSVVFEVSASGPKLLVEANPLLSDAAGRNLTTWTLPDLGRGRYLVIYSFGLSAPWERPREIPVGGGLNRLLLRLFHAPTTRTVYDCVEDKETRTSVSQTASPELGGYVIVVAVRSGSGCLNTEASQFARNSHL